MMYGVIKVAMDILGLHGGHMRLPLLDISDEDGKRLEKIILGKMVLHKTKWFSVFIQTLNSKLAS